jgi:hypothetical protein
MRKKSPVSCNLQYPAECTVNVRTGAAHLDDSASAIGRELLNTEKHIFNSGSERDGIVEVSCDTIAVVAMSSSTPPPNHVIFNLGPTYLHPTMQNHFIPLSCLLFAICFIVLAWKKCLLRSPIRSSS